MYARIGQIYSLIYFSFLNLQPVALIDRCIDHLLQNYLQKGRPVKLFLFAYMRGGSSIAGELFNCDPSATMWYEPGDSFFSAYYGLYHENLPQHDLYLKNMTRRYLIERTTAFIIGIIILLARTNLV